MGYESIGLPDNQGHSFRAYDPNMPDSPRTVVELWTECSQRIRDLRTLRLMLVEEDAAKGGDSKEAIRETDELLAEALRRERELLSRMSGRPASNGTS